MGELTDLLATTTTAQATVDEPDREERMTPLHYAAADNNPALIDILLHRKANLEAWTGCGETPVTIAAKGNHTEMCRMLLHRKANPNNSKTYTPLSCALSRGNTELVGLLLEHKANVKGETKLLHKTCKDGHLDMVKLMLQQGSFDINEPEGYKHETPLVTACVHGHHDIAALLLDRKADPHFEMGDFRNYTHQPMAVACDIGHPKVVQLLLDRGVASVNKVYEGGGNLDRVCGTPLQIAAQTGQEEVVQLLLQRKADPELKAEGSRRPIVVAHLLGYHRVVWLLLEHGAKPIQVTMAPDHNNNNNNNGRVEEGEGEGEGEEEEDADSSANDSQSDAELSDQAHVADAAGSDGEAEREGAVAAASTVDANANANANANDANANANDANANANDANVNADANANANANANDADANASAGDAQSVFEMFDPFENEPEEEDDEAEAEDEFGFGRGAWFAGSYDEPKAKECDRCRSATLLLCYFSEGFTAMHWACVSRSSTKLREALRSDEGGILGRIHTLFMLCCGC